LSALDFQKHYKMPVVHLLDSDRALERQYNRRGWPFLMLVDPSGQVVYKCNNLIGRDKELMQQLEKYKKGSFLAETRTAGGVSYMLSTLQRSGEDKKPLQNDRFTSIAAGAGGQIYAVFTSLKNGNSDIILRICNDELSYKDIPIGATDADEYDGTVLADTENQVWVCWTSNAVDDKYQIHLTSLKDVQEGRESVVVSKSKDDAMHGRRMNTGSSGSRIINGITLAGTPAIKKSICESIRTEPSQRKYASARPMCLLTKTIRTRLYPF
jgi:hypothetical protein